MEEKNTEEAFKWIVGLLKKHSIPFQVSGGFAARLYGSTRELNDIDIGVPDSGLAVLYPDVKQYSTFGPAHYLDEDWDVQLMTLNYKGQEIDIAGRDTIQFFDRTKNTWFPAYREPSKGKIMEVYGLSVPVVPKEVLITYKKKLMREADILDIKALES